MASVLLHAFAQRLHEFAASNGREQRRQQLVGRPRLLASRLKGCLDCAQQFRERQWLLDKVERAKARRLDRGIDSAVTRHDDDWTIHVTTLRPFTQQRDAICIRHPDIEQYEVKLAVRPRRARFSSVRGNRHAVSFVCEDFLYQRANVCFVVNY